MNNKRRDKINKIITSLKRSSSDLSDIIVKIDDVQNDESYAYDSLPENLQNTERAEKMEEAVDYLQDAYDSLVDAVNSIQEAQTSLSYSME